MTKKLLPNNELWGYLPSESTACSAEIHEMENDIRDRIEALFDAPHDEDDFAFLWSRIGVLYRVTEEWGVLFSEDIYMLAQNDVAILAKQTEWLDSWEDKQKVIDNLNECGDLFEEVRQFVHKLIEDWQESEGNKNEVENLN